MAWASLVFYVCGALSLLAALVGFLALGDLVQLAVSFRPAFTYRVFRVRFLLMAVAIGGLIAVLVLGVAYRLAPWWALGLYAFVVVFLFFSGFLAPSYVMFQTQQHTARFVPAAELNGQLADDVEVMAVEIDGDARAFPNAWIQRPHVVGDTVGGEPVVMTYCALSHLGVAYKNDLDGQPMNLKVMTQLENNLVLFDTVTQEPIEHLSCRLVNRDTRIQQVPSTVMPLRAFRTLYPQGTVFFNPPNGFLDRQVRRMMDYLLFAKGKHFDPSTPDPVFPTITHRDPRVPPKEQVYGVTLGSRAVAFTLGYLERNGGVATERIGDETITVKHFPEHDFVEMFFGDVPEVDARGVDASGARHRRVPHASRVLWMIWANVYRDTQVRV
jgi:hypothetical protein